MEVLITTRQSDREMELTRPAKTLWKSSLPSAMHSPFRWQRSSGASTVMNGGFQRGTKLWVLLRVQRQEKRVLTNQSSSASGVALAP